MPLMHSERLADQDRCIELFRARSRPDNLKFAEIHADIIRRFGRFPHRNLVLGRTTSAEEQTFLDAGGVCRLALFCLMDQGLALALYLRRFRDVTPKARYGGTVNG